MTDFADLPDAIRDLIDRATAAAFRKGVRRGRERGRGEVLAGLSVLGPVLKAQAPAPEPDAPAPDDGGADPRHALTLAMLDVAEGHADAGTDAGPELEALAALADDPAALQAALGRVAKGVVWKAWDSDLHPRDRAGRFISKEKLQAAKTDPRVAEELRDRVAPKDAGKLDRIIDGTVDPGRTKRGQQRHEAGQKRATKEQAAKRVRELTSLVLNHDAEPEHFAELAEHLPLLTKEQLRTARVKMDARFGAGKSPKRQQMVDALVAYARGRAAEPKAEEVAPASPAVDAATPAAPTAYHNGRELESLYGQDYADLPPHMQSHERMAAAVVQGDADALREEFSNATPGTPSRDLYAAAARALVAESGVPFLHKYFRQVAPTVRGGGVPGSAGAQTLVNGIIGVGLDRERENTEAVRRSKPDDMPAAPAGANPAPVGSPEYERRMADAAMADEAREAANPRREAELAAADDRRREAEDARDDRETRFQGRTDTYADQRRAAAQRAVDFAAGEQARAAGSDGVRGAAGEKPAAASPADRPRNGLVEMPAEAPKPADPLAGLPDDIREKYARLIRRNPAEMHAGYVQRAKDEAATRAAAEGRTRTAPVGDLIAARLNNFEQGDGAEYNPGLFGRAMDAAIEDMEKVGRDSDARKLRTALWGIEHMISTGRTTPQAAVRWRDASPLEAAKMLGDIASAMAGEAGQDAMDAYRQVLDGPPGQSQVDRVRTEAAESPVGQEPHERTRDAHIAAVAGERPSLPGLPRKPMTGYVGGDPRNARLPLSPEQEATFRRETNDYRRAQKRYKEHVEASNAAFHEHRRAVESALAAGKPVPPEVLADYPDLAAKAPASPPTRYGSEADPTAAEVEAASRPAPLTPAELDAGGWRFVGQHPDREAAERAAKPGQRVMESRSGWRVFEPAPKATAQAPATPPAPAPQAAPTAAAPQTGPVRLDDPAALRDALHAAALDLPDWQGKPREAAGWAGATHGVFLSDLYDHLKPRLPAGTTEDEFKQAALAASRSGHLELGRNDLPQYASSMDRVRRSEVGHLNASFHYLKAPNPQGPAAAPTAAVGATNGGAALDARAQRQSAYLRKRFPGLSAEDVAALVAGNHGEAAEAKAAELLSARAYPAPAVPDLAAASGAQKKFAEDARSQQLRRITAQLARLHLEATEPDGGGRSATAARSAAELQARRAAVAAIPDARFWLDTKHLDFSQLSPTAWGVVAAKLPASPPAPAPQTRPADNPPTINRRTGVPVQSPYAPSGVTDDMIREALEEDRRRAQARRAAEAGQ